MFFFFFDTPSSHQSLQLFAETSIGSNQYESVNMSSSANVAAYEDTQAEYQRKGLGAYIKSGEQIITKNKWVLSWVS